MQRNPESPGRLGAVSWDLRDMLLACALAFALVLLGLAAGAGLVTMLTVIGVRVPRQDMLILGVFALEALLLVPPWLFGPRKYGGGWRSLGLRSFALGQSLLILLLALPAVLAINAMWDVFREALGLAGQPDYLPLFGEGLGGLAVALLLGAGVAPVAEEVFFRGYLYAGLRARWGVGAALVASSLVFAVVHAVPGVLPPIFVMGLLFALLYERSGSIWPSIVLHSAVNALAFAAAYVAQHHPELIDSLARAVIAL